jgi:hypothetical protein
VNEHVLQHEVNAASLAGLLRLTTLITGPNLRGTEDSSRVAKGIVRGCSPEKVELKRNKAHIPRSSTTQDIHAQNRSPGAHVNMFAPPCS